MLRPYLILIPLLFLYKFSAGQNSKEFAQKGKLTWAAFECSVLASHIGDTTEGEKLFLKGYNEGKLFLKALEENKIYEKDIRSIVPIGLTLVLQGPTSDFVLGRIYAAASDNALIGIINTDGKSNNNVEQQILAKDKISKCNCELLK